MIGVKGKEMFSWSLLEYDDQENIFSTRKSIVARSLF